MSVTIAAFVTLAGCFADNSPDSRSATNSPTASASGPPPMIGASPLSLDGLSSFYWANSTAGMDYALDVTVDYGSSNRCDRRWAATTDGSVLGPVVLWLEGPMSNIGSLKSSSALPLPSPAPPINAHAGSIDTRVVDHESSTFVMSGNGTVSGSIRNVLVARGLAPGSNEFIKGNFSIAFAIACDAPFSLRTAMQSPQVFMANQWNAQGGAGASTTHDGDVAAGAFLEAKVEASKVRAACEVLGFQAAQVSLKRPSGTDTWTSTAASPADLRFIDDGPGTYNATFTGAGGSVNLMWCAAWGLDFPLDLNAGRLRFRPISLPGDGDF